MPSGIYKHKENVNYGMTGKKHSKTTKGKIGNSRIGKNHSKMTKGKMRKAHKGKKLSEMHKINIGKASKGRNLGEKSPHWRGGISFSPYSVDWTKILRISIRERDKYVCQLCGEKQGDRAHSVHHIDYNKKNCNPNNLITLCNHCHTRTNFNRKYWVSYFTDEN